MRVWQTVLLVFWAWGVIILLTQGSDLETLPFPDMSWGPQISILSEMLKAEGSVLLLYYSYWSSGRLSFYLFNHFWEIFSSFQKSCKNKNDAKKKYIPFTQIDLLISPTPSYIRRYTCVFTHVHTHFFKAVWK